MQTYKRENPWQNVDSRKELDVFLACKIGIYFRKAYHQSNKYLRPIKYAKHCITAIHYIDLQNCRAWNSFLLFGQRITYLQAKFILDDKLHAFTIPSLDTTSLKAVRLKQSFPSELFAHLHPSQSHASILCFCRIWLYPVEVQCSR